MLSRELLSYPQQDILLWQRPLIGKVESVEAFYGVNCTSCLAVVIKFFL
jgi:hypothetical protein